MKTRGSVEDWLLKVEDAMFNSIRLLLKKSLSDFAVMPYDEWLFAYSHQVSIKFLLYTTCILLAHKTTVKGEIKSTIVNLNVMLEYLTVNVVKSLI